jgi:hypothetical protein
LYRCLYIYRFFYGWVRIQLILYPGNSYFANEINTLMALVTPLYTTMYHTEIHFWLWETPEINLMEKNAQLQLHRLCLNSCFVYLKDWKTRSWLYFHISYLFVDVQYEDKEAIHNCQYLVIREDYLWRLCKIVVSTQELERGTQSEA